MKFNIPKEWIERKGKGEPMGANGRAQVYERDGVTYLAEVKCEKCDRADGLPSAAPMQFGMTELKAWRLLGRDLEPVLDRILAAQGELPWPEVVKLQHALAELLRPPAPETSNA